MKIRTSDPQTLEVTGLKELMAANASQARDAIRAQLTPGHTVLNINLSAVSFLDSSGLGILISLHKTMRAQNGVLRLIQPAPGVSQVLELTHMNQMFEIVKT
jgi:anti-sigma B factor antagonist